MGKKNKQRKKGRASKGFNSTPRKQGKDAVTGLSVELDNYGTLESDKVYGPDSELIQRANQEAGFTIEGDLWYEFELGSDKVVFTSRFTGNENSFTDEGYQRGVVTGKFDYANGRLTSAVIDGISAHNIDFKDGGKYYEQSYIQRFPEPRKVSNIRQTPPWDYALREEGAQDIMFAQWSTGNIFNTNEGNVADIYGHLGGKIFEPGWWSNPFAPNLI